MDEKTSGAWDTVRGCLAAAGAFLFLVFLLRFSHLSLGGLELFLLPLAVGFGTGLLIGSRWKRPVLASLLLGAALIVAATIPYTIDTVSMANESDEAYAKRAREYRGPNLVDLASLPPSELRRLAVHGRIISFVMFGPLFIGGLTTLGALARHRLGRG